jgi:general secretion pathway protein L
MSETLLIHYNIENAHQATWALCNDTGELTGKISSGTLDELSEDAANHHTVVLLNSQCLHINQLQLPTQNLQKMLKGVPYAVEEFIAEDIENFHFVIARNKHNNLVAVVGIDKITLQNIIQVFHQANISIEKIIPDVLCMAADDQQWVCLNYLDTSYLQTDRLNGIALSNDILPYILSKKLQDETQDSTEQKPPEKILLFTEQENTTAFDQLQLDNLSSDERPERINIVYNKHPLVVFCGHYKQALPLNLLQHEFKNKRKSSGLWQHWRLAASLAAIWLVLNLALSSFSRPISHLLVVKIYKCIGKLFYFYIENKYFLM